MRHLLKKENGVVTQKSYKQTKDEDKNFYYVLYSNRINEMGEYIVYTNSILYGESRSIFKSTNKDEVIKIAEIINKAIRLLAGYYDGDSDHKNHLFPSTLKRQ